MHSSDLNGLSRRPTLWFDRLHPRQLLHRRAQFARKGPHHPIPHPIPRHRPPVHRRGYTRQWLALYIALYHRHGVPARGRRRGHPARCTSSPSGPPHPVRACGTNHGTAPLTQRQAESIHMSILLGFVLPSVLVGRTFGPYLIALWEPFPWWMSATQALYRLATPRRPRHRRPESPGLHQLSSNPLCPRSPRRQRSPIRLSSNSALLPFRLRISPHDLPA